MNYYFWRKIELKLNVFVIWVGGVKFGIKFPNYRFHSSHKSLDQRQYCSTIQVLTSFIVCYTIAKFVLSTFSQWMPFVAWSCTQINYVKIMCKLSMSVRLTQIVVWFIPYFMVIACVTTTHAISLVQLTSIGRKWKSGEIRRIWASGSVTNHSPSSNIAWVTRNLEIFLPVNIYGFYSKFNGAKIGSTHRWEVEIQQDLGRLFWLIFGIFY